MAIPVFFNCDTLNIDHEKMALQQLKQKLMHKHIILIEGNHSDENKIYTEAAPADIRGILSIEAALQALGLHFTRVKTTAPDLNTFLSRCDYVLIYAHGIFGEDGRLQGWLEYIGVDYPGPGVSASALCCDKLYFKHLMRACKIQTPAYEELVEDDNAFTLHTKAVTLGYPVMIKERQGGSSLGITLIANRTALHVWLSQRDNKPVSAYFMEKYIDGVFATVGIIQLTSGYYVLPVFSVKTGAPFYDADTKIGKPGTALTSQLNAFPEAIADTLRHTAWDAFTHAGCEGLARVDFVLGADGPWILEINTIPGLSRTANFTQMFTALGFSYEELILAVMNTAFIKPSRQTKEIPHEQTGICQPGLDQTV